VKLIAKTFAGLEDLLASEIAALGGTNVETTKRGVIYEGDTRLLYRSNLELRTALRVLMPIHQFKASDEQTFYKRMREVDWWRYMDVRQTLAVDAIAKSDKFRHSHYVGLKTKDAIVDQFRDKMNRRPSIDTDQPDLKVNVHVHNDEVSVSLDASSESLHRRGYRASQNDAPLNEVLAAAMIQFSKWESPTTFCDAMCGSGTLLTEAALIASNTPPQYRRTYFGFKRWVDFDKRLYEGLMSEYAAQRVDFQTLITGSDIHGLSLRAAERNIDSAGFQSKIKVQKADFFTRKPPTENGVLIINPPYDERMSLDDAVGFYKKIGDALKHNWKGWTAWVLSGNLEAAKHIGLRPTRRIHLFNGALECRFLKFEVY
jgi:putative N6-adenine-specific DNA methylase